MKYRNKYNAKTEAKTEATSATRSQCWRNPDVSSLYSVCGVCGVYNAPNVSTRFGHLGSASFSVEIRMSQFQFPTKERGA